MSDPCSPGCRGHVTHPCEKCGTQWSDNPSYQELEARVQILEARNIKYKLISWILALSHRWNLGIVLCLDRVYMRTPFPIEPQHYDSWGMPRERRHAVWTIARKNSRWTGWIYRLVDYQITEWCRRQL